jgi:hypothetical protein
MCHVESGQVIDRFGNRTGMERGVLAPNCNGPVQIKDTQRRHHRPDLEHNLPRCSPFLSPYSSLSLVFQAPGRRCQGVARLLLLSFANNANNGTHRKYRKDRDNEEQQKHPKS